MIARLMRFVAAIAIAALLVFVLLPANWLWKRVKAAKARKVAAA